MIITLILNLFAFLLGGIISILPNGAIPTQWVTAVYALWSYGVQFQYVFPTRSLLFWLSAVLVFNVAVAVFKLFNWIIRKIPGIS